MRSIRTYLEILRKKGVYTCLREAKKAVWPVWWTHSRAAIEQIQAERTNRYLWKRYGPLIAKPLDKEAKSVPDKTIWMCWLQGEEQAPPIVRQCIASVRHYASDYNVVVLTAETMSDYVSLPDHIWRKYDSGTITFTHFSDILRTALLVQHGGIWLDATVLLTGSLPEHIVQEPLFFLQKSILSLIPHAGSSWLLAAHKGNAELQRVLDVLCAYWKQENILRDYYLFHCILYLVLTHNEQASALYKGMAYIPNGDAHTLQYRLFEDFNERQWNHICSRSAIHKLTWKFNHNEPIEKSGTYYDHILHHLHL
ncbi:MAG: capsular polysaccharide synthesis protein [Paludibacteraceae bacterium]|nr:capsular polysaccharide synthesis protein [Paludibacteraceae bacterium]